MAGIDKLIKQHQQKILNHPSLRNLKEPLSERTKQAFMATPRHHFVPRYRIWGQKEWQEVTEENLESHLPKLYENGSLGLFLNENGWAISTISQPTLVLQMLDMLQVEPGHTILELGAGSGWNAALLGELVGQTGSVYSVEIIPEMAQRASNIISGLGIKNVHIIEADGGDGYKPAAPYDRAIFTAGTFDLPHHFFDQIKENGLLLTIIKNEGGGDILFLLQKTNDHFQSIDSMSVGFVPMTGKYEMTELNPILLKEVPNWDQLKGQEVSRRSFWWGGKGDFGFMWRTLGIRSFLSIVEPTFQAFKTEKEGSSEIEQPFFGLWDQASNSICYAKDDEIVSFGNATAEHRFMQHVNRWVELGMPSAASFDLKIYRRGRHLEPGTNQWVVKRNESQFLWELPER